MKAMPEDAHPSVPYWNCPACKVTVAADGELFQLTRRMGFTVETADLAKILPRTMLELLETGVEQHEAVHLRLAGAS